MVGGREEIGSARRERRSLSEGEKMESGSEEVVGWEMS
jgi:hypothetical protein